MIYVIQKKQIVFFLNDESLKSESSKIHFDIFSHQKKSGKFIRFEINEQKENFEYKRCLLVVAFNRTKM